MATCITFGVLQFFVLVLESHWFEIIIMIRIYIVSLKDIYILNITPHLRIFKGCTCVHYSNGVSVACMV